MKKKVNKLKKNIKDELCKVDKEKVIAIYVRESTKMQAVEGYNIHTQEHKCREYLKIISEELPYKIKVYSEKGASAKTIDRPVLNDLRMDIEKGNIACVIVQKLDRMARTMLGMAQLLEFYKENDVRFITIREGIDTDKPMYKMFVNFYIQIAENELETISERTREALVYGASIGSYVKGGIPPFGTIRHKVYNDDGSHKFVLLPHPINFTVLKMIYRLSFYGENTSKISQKVNNLKVMIDQNKKLSEDAIENILSNKIYCGIQYVDGNEYEVDFESCFEKEYWEQVQKNRSIHLQRNTHNEYLYHGKVFCECGTLCIVDVTNKRLADGTIKKYHYYVCPNCKKRISEKIIYESVEPKIKYKFNLDVNEKYKDKQVYKINRINELKDDLHDLYLEGSIDRKMYIDQLKKMYKNCDMLSKRIKRKKSDYRSLDVCERKEYINQAVRSINVDMKSKNICVKYAI